MRQHHMITSHQASSLGYKIVVTVAANVVPVDACCVTSLAWCSCAPGVTWCWPCKYSMTKQRVMKALSGVCTNGLSLNLGLHCCQHVVNPIFPSLSLFLHVPEWEESPQAPSSPSLAILDSHCPLLSAILSRYLGIHRSYLWLQRALWPRPAYRQYPRVETEEKKEEGGGL